MSIETLKEKADKAAAALANATKPEVLRILDERKRMETQDKGAVHAADFDSKSAVKRIPLASVTLLGRANPRLNFSNLAGLKASIELEGQKDAIVVRKLTGEALSYVRRLSGIECNEETLFVTRGARRVSALRELASEYSAAKPGEPNPFETVRAILAPDFKFVSEFVSDVLDNVGREGLTTRVEQARAIGMLRDAGWTLDAIAKSHGKSIGWVQDALRVMDLPNTPEHGFVLNALESYDLAKARYKNGAGSEEDVAKEITFSNDAVKRLARAFSKKIGTYDPSKKKKNESEPEDFDTLWTLIQANKGIPETPGTNVPPVSDARIAEIRAHVEKYWSGEKKLAALCTLDALRAVDVSGLRTHDYTPPAPSAVTSPELPATANVPPVGTMPNVTEPEVEGGTKHPAAPHKGRKGAK